MSWMHRLYETYDANQHRIGDPNDKVPLLPVLHTLQAAHIEISLNEIGNLISAKVVPKEDASTIIPCAEASLARSGIRPANHPLCDRLQYVAGDFVAYSGEVTSGFSETPSKPFDDYLAGLKAWCESADSHAWVHAVYSYVRKKCLVLCHSYKFGLGTSAGGR